VTARDAHPYPVALMYVSSMAALQIEADRAFPEPPLDAG
jgi:hypothetical protein